MVAVTRHCVARVTYYDWLREEARLINSDGCSGVTNAFEICCLQHDLEFFYARSATEAFRWWQRGRRDYWIIATPITFEAANKHFRACHFRESRFGYLNPFGWWRYAIVRRQKGREAWEKHRVREAEAVG